MSVNNVNSLGFNVNGKLDEAVQQGSRGDCALIAYCEALNQSEAGQLIFQDSIQINKDANGEVSGYTVNFNGINESYNISLDELAAATDDNSGQTEWVTKTWNDFSEEEKDIYRAIYPDWSEEALATIEIQESSFIPAAGSSNRYSKGDDDMKLIELAVEKCLNQSGNQEVQNLRTSLFNQSNLDDALSAINTDVLNLMFVGNTENKDFSTVKNTMQYLMDSYSLGDNYTPSENFELKDKNGNTVTLDTNANYEILENSKDIGPNGTVTLRNTATGEETSYDFAEFYKNTVSKQYFEETIRNIDSLIENSDDSKAVIFSLGSSIAEKTQDTYLKDIYGNDQLLYSNHGYVVTYDSDNTVRLINPHDTSVELIFNKEDLYKLPTFEFQSFDLT